jgi:hypothetical protein
LWNLKSKIIVCFGVKEHIRVERLKNDTPYPFTDYKLNIVVNDEDISVTFNSDVYCLGSLVYKQADINLARNTTFRNFLLHISITEMIDTHDVSFFMVYLYFNDNV